MSKNPKVLQRKVDKQIRKDESIRKEIENGPSLPPSVNNYLNGGSTVAIPNNSWLDKLWQSRCVEPNTPAVNGKTNIDGLIHSPESNLSEQRIFPIIDVNYKKKLRDTK